MKASEKHTKIKENGRIYTPAHIVKNMLSMLGYSNKSILEKHIIDNSAGDGAFLTAVVETYCEIFLKNNDDRAELKQHLSTFIHGVEIDKTEHAKCISNLNEIAAKYGICGVSWDIICADTLTISKYNNKMDYVIGNPPYVRIHNLAKNRLKVKKLSFCEKGMPNLYLAFIEIGLRMLKQDGKMCLITPSSCLRSQAGIKLREYISAERNLTKIVDLGHYQAFNAKTYTMITLFEKSRKVDRLDYYTYNNNKLRPVFRASLSYSDIFIGRKIYVSDLKQLKLLKQIEEHYQNAVRKVVVKNGITTLADSVFIADFNFKTCVIDIIKASTSETHKCIFPYSADGSAMTIDELKKKHADVYNYLLQNKNILEKRDLEKGGSWFLLGRTQGLKDVFQDKITINTNIKGIKDIRLNNAPAGTGIYNGLYILNNNHTFEKISAVLKSDDFIEYLQILKNYKNAGYYTISSTELAKYLTYRLETSVHLPNIRKILENIRDCVA